jgi:methylated-DNA-protein-cysteine methyltransferase-like protein
MGHWPSAATLEPVPRDRDEHRQRILAVVDSIPRGRVATYGQVAREAGLARRARLVGRILAQLPSGSSLPWHRVVNASGRISLRSGSGAALQRRRLAREGVRFTPAGRIDLGRFRWSPDP